MPLRIVREGYKAAQRIKEKKEREDKSRNPNPKTPTMMGQEIKKDKDRITQRDLDKMKERLKNIRKRNPDRGFLKEGNTFQKLSKGGLKGNQKKLDKNNNNRIDAQDFKILKAEKAKGRGMGLQDEKVKPGKVMKAKRGKLGEAKDYKNYLKGLKKATSEVRGAKLNSPAYNILSYDQKTFEKAGGKGKAVFKDYKGLGIKNEDQYFKEKNKFLKRRKALSTVGKAAKSTRLGKIALGVAGAGIAAKKFIESDKFKNMLKDRKKEGKFPFKKKMGGGMMMKPMGYKSGTMVMSRGCKLGRKKATKIT